MQRNVKAMQCNTSIKYKTDDIKQTELKVTLMSSGVMGAQKGSTKAQNRLGVSFLGKDDDEEEDDEDWCLLED